MNKHVTLEALAHAALQAESTINWGLQGEAIDHYLAWLAFEESGSHVWHDGDPWPRGWEPIS